MPWMASLRLFFHLVEPGVVVCELVQVSQGDLAGEDRIIVRDIRAGVTPTVLQFHFEAHAELLDIKRALAPIDTDRCAYPSSFIGCEPSRDAHVDLLWVLGSLVRSHPSYTFCVMPGEESP